MINFVLNSFNMKILLSPAKKLDFDKDVNVEKSSPLIFPKETDRLISVLKKKSVKKIGELMKLSPQLSQLNYERYQAYGTNENIKTLAGFGFNGEVYTGLDIASMSESELEEANSKILILSGLYGVLKPFTVIEPYRLEMGTSLKVGVKKNLYEFWGDKIHKFISTEEKELIVNLASNEYNKAALLSKFKGKVITPVFKEFKNGDYKTIMVFAKKARGMMARWIIQNNVEDPAAIKEFTEDGYVFNEALSKNNNWVFTR